jgi:hypothetical protein
VGGRSSASPWCVCVCVCVFVCVYRERRRWTVTQDSSNTCNTFLFILFIFIFTGRSGVRRVSRTPPTLATPSATPECEGPTLIPQVRYTSMRTLVLFLKKHLRHAHTKEMAPRACTQSTKRPDPVLLLSSPPSPPRPSLSLSLSHTHSTLTPPSASLRSWADPARVNVRRIVTVIWLCCSNYAMCACSKLCTVYV